MAKLEDTLEKKLQHYRISHAEYDRIQTLIGREPRGVEWALFSAMWSEHCSYKSSRIHLKNLFNKSPRVLMAFGENAGVIDLGAGEKVAFKMESHNHPSFIEPYEGAATGVGGILRDVFTMGARPIALANYLCFGEPKAPRMASLVDGVVRGIGGYGNCVGVPTITGQTEFHSSYNKNVLVNALALGLFREGEPILSAKAAGVGNLVVYVGAKTGKDGVHGASMASEAFAEDSSAKKPTIQKGDPFYEKLLIESCLEVMREKLVVAVQDMGAAGLTSSSFEMAGRGEVGLNLHLDRVPLRDSSMTPEEILLSESQERMLLIVEPKNLERLKTVFSHWDLDAEAIGEVTTGPEVELYWRGESICKLDPKYLVDEAPRYERAFEPWREKNRGELAQVLAQVTNSKKPDQRLLSLLSDARAASRSWIYHQYDQRVGAKTARDCADSVGVVRLPDSGRALGVVLGGRPHVMRFDAAVGAIDSIAYPALELAAKGMQPLAATDCLNFGNPEHLSIMSEFVATISNLSAQCEALAVPVISGNVSFYNETLGENITSTPATGLVGLRDDLKNMPMSCFTEKNAEVYLLSHTELTFTGLWSDVDHKPALGSGSLNVKNIASFVELVRNLSLHEGVQGTRVVGKFGLGYALARMCRGPLGVDARGLKADDLFVEKLYQVIFAVGSDQAFRFREAFAALQKNSKSSQLERIGEVAERTFKLGSVIDLKLEDLQSAYNTSWEVIFAGLS
jgi:phosphoribosylformylglycinamidine synthase subunit PurL